MLYATILATTVVFLGNVAKVLAAGDFGPDTCLQGERD